MNGYSMKQLQVDQRVDMSHFVVDIVLLCLSKRRRFKEPSVSSIFYVQFVILLRLSRFRFFAISYTATTSKKNRKNTLPYSAAVDNNIFRIV